MVKGVSFKEIKEKDMIEFIKNKDFSYYVKNLIREDMQRVEYEKNNIKENKKRVADFDI